MSAKSVTVFVTVEVFSVEVEAVVVSKVDSSPVDVVIAGCTEVGPILAVVLPDRSSNLVSVACKLVLISVVSASNGKIVDSTEVAVFSFVSNTPCSVSKEVIISVVLSSEYWIMEVDVSKISDAMIVSEADTVADLLVGVVIAICSAVLVTFSIVLSFIVFEESVLVCIFLNAVVPVVSGTAMEVVFAVVLLPIA